MSGGVTFFYFLPLSSLLQNMLLLASFNLGLSLPTVSQPVTMTVSAGQVGRSGTASDVMLVYRLVHGLNSPYYTHERQAVRSRFVLIRICTARGGG